MKSNYLIFKIVHIFFFHERTVPLAHKKNSTTIKKNGKGREGELTVGLDRNKGIARQSFDSMEQHLLLLNTCWF
jgi:hypothetical protein